jgi:hypothetical protein
MGAIGILELNARTCFRATAHVSARPTHDEEFHLRQALPMGQRRRDALPSLVAAEHRLMREVRTCVYVWPKEINP